VIHLVVFWIKERPNLSAKTSRISLLDTGVCARW